MAETRVEAEEGGGPRSGAGRPLLAVLIAASLGASLPGLTTFPGVTVDEPWYANTAHNLAHGVGLVNTNTGWRGGDEFFLYPLLLAPVLALGGTSLVVVRLFSVACGLLALAGIWRLGRTLGLSTGLRLLVGATFIAGNLFFIVVRRGRPEALVLALTVAGVAALLVVLARPGRQRRRWREPFLAGLCLGLAFLAHPNGILLVALGALVLVLADLDPGRTGQAGAGRLAGTLPGYLLGAGVCGLALLLHILVIRGTSLEVFLGELLGSGRVSAPGTGSGWLAEASALFTGVSLGWRRLLVVCLELVVLAWALLRWRRDRLAGALGILGLGYLTLAVLFLSPFPRPGLAVAELLAVLATGRLLATLRPASPARRLLLGAALLSLANQAVGDIVLAVREHDRTDFRHIERALEETVAPDAVVVTPLPFWFGFPDATVYTHSTRWDRTAHRDLDALLASGTVTTVIRTDYQRARRSPTTGLSAPPLPGKYRHFLDRLATWTPAHATRIRVIPTSGYGTIEVWRVP